MSNARKLADLLDSAGDIKSAHLDNVPASDDASALTTGTLPIARIAAGSIVDAKLATGIDATKLTGTIASGRLSASNMGSGTIPDARFPATLPAISGANLTGLVSTIAASTDATVSASDPASDSNPSATGHYWINKTSGECYVCTTATTDENVWKNVGPGTGDVVPAFYVTATGPDGAAGVTDGDYKYHIFNATKTGSAGFVVSNAGNADGSNTVEYLVVAGGGGGGSSGGGGGAGGYRTASGFTSPTVGNHNITIGAGGAGTYGVGTGQGADGSNSVFSSITSTGGGGGGEMNQSYNGRAGGSGGGGAVNYPSTSLTSGGAGTSGQGNAGGGGRWNGNPDNYAAGGGGGAGAVGGHGGNFSASTAYGGDGGVGLASSITGSSVYRAGGGGGASYGSNVNNLGGAGGNGGGGSKGGPAGTANTGGGGGGPASWYDSFNGGSGVVIIRYKFQN